MMGAVSMPKPALARTRPRPPPLRWNGKCYHMVGFRIYDHTYLKPHKPPVHHPKVKQIMNLCSEGLSSKSFIRSEALIFLLLLLTNHCHFIKQQQRVLQYHQTPSSTCTPIPLPLQLPEFTTGGRSSSTVSRTTPPYITPDNEHPVLCHIFSEGMANLYKKWITFDTELWESVVSGSSIISYPPLAGGGAANPSAGTCDVMETDLCIKWIIR